MRKGGTGRGERELGTGKPPDEAGGDDAQVSQVDFSLVESTSRWDEPGGEGGGLKILRRLLRILDPEWNVILETASRLETVCSMSAVQVSAYFCDFKLSVLADK